jgi:hypothetical protein
MRRNALADAGAFTGLVHGLPHDLRSNGHIRRQLFTVPGNR